jgi:hypothetical protein
MAAVCTAVIRFQARETYLFLVHRVYKDFVAHSPPYMKDVKLYLTPRVYNLISYIEVCYVALQTFISVSH